MWSGMDLNEQWVKVTANLTDFDLSTWVTFLYLCAIYFVAAFPYWVIDYFGWFARYKIQPNEKYDSNKVWKCIKVLFFNHVVLALPLIFISYPILKFRGVQFGAPLPDPLDVGLRCLLYFMLEDTWFYFGHRWLHTDWAYRNIHRQHHEFTSPIGMASSYAHPVEFLFLGVGTFLGPVICGGDHIVGIWAWAFIRQVEAIEVHCGYDFPWNLSKIVPFYCGPPHHDHHHSSWDGNYASTFVWWDRVFRTDDKYREFKTKGGHRGLAGRKEKQLKESDVYPRSTQQQKAD